jgi:hypothetical protein
MAGLVTLGSPALAQFTAPARPAQAAPPAGMPPIPLDALAPGLRERVASVLENPALSARGPVETFNAAPATYRWLLEHPDLTVKLWRQLGAKVSDIHDHGGGRYCWQDGQGSEVHWHAALRQPGHVLWYAEGKVKPAALLPMTNFRAIALLQYVEGKDPREGPAIRHQVHFMIRCDSRAVTLAARILGASAPRQAELYLGQLQMFYGGMAWYLNQDENRARQLYARIGLSVAEPPRDPAR